MTVFQIKHFFCALVLFSLWACQPSGQPQIRKEVEQKKDVSLPQFYKITGSKTLGVALMPALLEGYLIQQGIQLKQKKRLAAGYIYSWEQAGKKMRLELLPKGSQAGFSALAAGQAQLAMASKSIDDSLIKSIHPFKQEQQLLLAYDALRVLVHKEKANIQNLSKAQLAKIFSGKIKDWSEIDARFSGPIRLYLRNEHSGSFHFVQNILGTLGALHKQQQNFTYLLRDLANDPNGLAFAPYDLPESLAIYSLQIDGQTASLERKDYLFRRPLYLYLDSMALEDPFWMNFMAFCRSVEGQKIIAQEGFSPLV